MGDKLSALRIIFVFVDIEDEVRLSFSEMSINVSQFEFRDIIVVDANDLSALSDDRVTAYLHGNQGLGFLPASLYTICLRPTIKKMP